MWVRKFLSDKFLSNIHPNRTTRWMMKHLILNEDASWVGVLMEGILLCQEQGNFIYPNGQKKYCQKINLWNTNHLFISTWVQNAKVTHNGQRKFWSILTNRSNPSVSFISPSPEFPQRTETVRRGWGQGIFDFVSRLIKWTFLLRCRHTLKETIFGEQKSLEFIKFLVSSWRSDRLQ